MLAALTILLAASLQDADQRARAPGLPVLPLEAFPAAVRPRAEAAYERARQRPDSAAATGELGLLLHAYDQLASADAAYRRARTIEPQAFEWAYLSGVVQLRLGRNPDAAAALGEAVRLDPASVPARIRLAEALLATGDISGAAALYEALLKDEPGLAQAHYGLGRVEAGKGRREAALEHYRTALQLFAEYGAARYALGLALRDLGRAGEARGELALYEKHRMGAPPLADPVLDRVRAVREDARERLAEGARLGLAGDVEGAIREHERALALDPQMAQAHANLIALHGRAGRWQEAERHYRAATALAPGLAETHYDYGVVLNQQSRHAEAAEAFRKALAINPYYAAAHNNLGTMLEAQGQIEEAARHYREAVANDPAYRLARFNLGRLLVALGRPREAAEELERTLAPEDAETPRYMYALAAAWARAGDRGQALRWGEEARRRAEALGQAELAATIARDLQQLAPPQ